MIVQGNSVFFIDRLVHILITDDDQHLTSPDGLRLNGSYDHSAAVIVLRAGMTSSLLVPTLAHELAHAVDAIGKLDLTHSQVSILGMALQPLAKTIAADALAQQRINLAELDFGA